MRYLPAVAISLCFAITACGSSYSENPEPPLGEVKRVNSGSDISLPLDAYDTTAEERAALQKVYDLFGIACMKKKGFKVTMPERRTESSESVYGRRYFIVRMDEAARFGYRPARMMENDQEKIKNMKTGLESPAAHKAWTDQDPDDNSNPNKATGCGAAALPVVDKGVGKDSDIVIHNLSSESWHRSEQDSRMQAVFKEWSSCMATSGFTYTTPIESNNDKRWHGEVTPLEIATAKADVSCKQKSNLAGLWLAVETAYQERQIEENAEALRVRRAVWDIRMRNARQALGG
ncbi:hypothetical protein ACFQ71_38210 [Streptomyces sp. NPDC056534]|uniref:hypothetical protein n=1 Tax=Streptomyces sp. NPDC056534 TaxID=3345857 RepID=UPI0036C722B3